MNNSYIQIRLPRSLKNSIRSFSKKNKTTSSNIVRHAVAHYLQDQGKWIPVSDSLPIDNEWYLVTDGGNYAPGSGDELVEIAEYSYSGHWINECGIPRDFVTHWMPIPDIPFKAEQ